MYQKSIFVEQCWVASFVRVLLSNIATMAASYLVDRDSGFHPHTPNFPASLPAVADCSLNEKLDLKSTANSEDEFYSKRNYRELLYNIGALLTSSFFFSFLKN